MKTFIFKLKFAFYVTSLIALVVKATPTLDHQKSMHDQTLEKVNFLIHYAKISQENLKNSLAIQFKVYECLKLSPNQNIQIELLHRTDRSKIKKSITCNKLVQKLWVNSIEKSYAELKMNYAVSQKELSSDSEQILNQIFIRKKLEISDLLNTNESLNLDQLIYQHFNIDPQVFSLDQVHKIQIRNEFLKFVSHFCKSYSSSEQFNKNLARLNSLYNSTQINSIKRSINCMKLEFEPIDIKDYSYQSIILKSFAAALQPLLQDRQIQATTKFYEILTLTPYLLFLNQDLIKYLENWKLQRNTSDQLKVKALTRVGLYLQGLKKGYSEFNQEINTLSQIHQAILLKMDLVSGTDLQNESRVDQFYKEQNNLNKIKKLYQRLLSIFNNKMYLKAYMLVMNPNKENLVNDIVKDLEQEIQKNKDIKTFHENLVTGLTLAQMFVPNRVILKPFQTFLGRAGKVLSQSQKLFILFSFHFGMYSAYQSLVMTSAVLELINGFELSLQSSGYETPQDIRHHFELLKTVRLINILI